MRLKSFALTMVAIALCLAALNQKCWSQERSTRTRVALALSHAAAIQKEKTLNATRTVQAMTSPKTLTLEECTCGPGCVCGVDCVCVGDKCYRITGAKKTGFLPTCSCGEGCTCTAGQCGDPSCPSRRATTAPGPIEWLAFEVQYQKAVKQNKPLLIWVGETCPSCESQWTEYIHARLSEYDPATGTPYTGPGVIVGKPDTLGGMKRVSTLPGIPTKTAVDGAINGDNTQSGWNQVPQRNVVAQPQFFMPPPMPMMPMGGFGGFGGGMMMGGGGGGC